MTGIPHIEIIESADTRKNLMKQQKTALNKVANILNNLQQDFILSLAGWDYIVNALSV